MGVDGILIFYYLSFKDMFVFFSLNYGGVGRGYWGGGRIHQ